MADFNVRADSVDVEQVMEQIRARIREKRGVDYTEQQLRELAAVKLEKFLDPRGVRSDLLQRFKERQPQYEKPLLPLYTFENTAIYDTHRGPLRWIRKLLHPILKLLFNPNPIIHAFQTQVEINKLNLEREQAQEKRRIEMEALYYEIIHNLVFELTRTGIEVKNLKMRVESLASRVEFNERRARALESVVMYKPSREEESGRQERREPAAIPDSRPPAQESRPPASDARPPAPDARPQGGPEGPGQRSRRRRRRRGRRGGAPASSIMGGPSTPLGAGAPQGAGAPGQGVSGNAPADSPASSTEPPVREAAAETVEQALASDVHAREPHAAPEPAPAPSALDPDRDAGGSGPDDQ
jgi:hypothetical protein